MWADFPPGGIRETRPDVRQCNLESGHKGVCWYPRSTCSTREHMTGPK